MRRHTSLRKSCTPLSCCMWVEVEGLWFDLFWRVGFWHVDFSTRVELEVPKTAKARISIEGNEVLAAIETSPLFDVVFHFSLLVNELFPDVVPRVGSRSSCAGPRRSTQFLLFFVVNYPFYVKNRSRKVVFLLFIVSILVFVPEVLRDMP